MKRISPILCAAFGFSLVAACIPTVRDDARSPITADRSAAPADASSATWATSAQRGGSVVVRFLDVGQGDSALVSTSDAHSMLIDSGPPEGAARVLSALKQTGIPLDTLVLSHAHADHLGALSQAAKLFPMSRFIESGFSEHAVAEYRKLHAALEEAHVSLHAARRGEHFALGSFTDVAVLAPRDPLITHTRSDVNSNSIVVRLDHHAAKGDVRMLFVGDAEHQTEERLLEHPEELASDVLKVAHHGSKHASSDTFLSAVHPKLGVISCAVGNDYGHPHAPTLKRLHSRGIQIARTDIQGDVTVTSDDSGLRWATQKEVDPAQLTLPGTTTKEREAP